MDLSRFLFSKFLWLSALLMLTGACTQKLESEDLRVGQGPAVKTKDIVRVHYVGWLKDDGSIFDDTYKRNKPYLFVVGSGRVIDGWDQGIQGMKAGGKRRLTIPPSLAYGDQDKSQRGVPPNSTLVFEIELLEIIDAAQLIVPDEKDQKKAKSTPNKE